MNTAGDKNRQPPSYVHIVCYMLNTINNKRGTGKKYREMISYKLNIVNYKKTNLWKGIKDDHIGTYNAVIQSLLKHKVGHLPLNGAFYLGRSLMAHWSFAHSRAGNRMCKIIKGFKCRVEMHGKNFRISDIPSCKQTSKGQFHLLPLLTQFLCKLHLGYKQ